MPNIDTIQHIGSSDDDNQYCVKCMTSSNPLQLFVQLAVRVSARII